jgi:uncharacterized protein (DUF2236 family)
MIVTQRELDEALAHIRAETKRPAEGLFGPESVTWRIARDGVVFLGAGRAALLQLAHPYVAHAIEQHSETRRDPIGRFNRTFLHVYGMIFGDLEAALGAAQRVRGIHDGVHGAIDEDVGRFPRGHRYHAHDPGALLWVLATLVETSVMAFEMAYGPLGDADKEGYWQECRLFGRLFGLSEERLPPDWEAFKAYCARMYAGDHLAVGRPALETASFLLSGRGAPLAPVMRFYATITAGMLPPRLRAAYGLAYSRADAMVYEATLRAVRATWRRVPARLRLRPEYVEAMRRLAGEPRVDRLGRAMQEAVLRSVRPR